MADDLAVGIEQVELEAGIDNHDILEQLGQVFALHLAPLDQHVFLDNVFREIAIELLADFLLPENVYTVSGGHDWITWAQLWVVMFDDLKGRRSNMRKY